MRGLPVALTYPDPELTDGAVRLRRWSDRDLGCVEEAAADSRIPAGTSVPAVFGEEAGRAFVRRQWHRAESGEGLSLAVADAGTDEALGLAFLGLRPERGVAGIGYWVIPRGRRRGLATAAVRSRTTPSSRSRSKSTSPATGSTHTAKVGDSSNAPPRLSLNRTTSSRTTSTRSRSPCRLAWSPRSVSSTESTRSKRR